MSQKAGELASQLEQAINDFAEVVESYPDDRWMSARSEEGWTIAAAAQHVSGQFPLEMEYITAAAEGREMPGYSWDDINGVNDRRAEENTSVSKAKVLAELREQGSAAAAYIRGLHDEQLNRTSELALAGGAEVSTQQLIEGGVLIEHLAAHAKSIQAAS